MQARSQVLLGAHRISSSSKAAADACSALETVSRPRLPVDDAATNGGLARSCLVPRAKLKELSGGRRERRRFFEVIDRTSPAVGPGSLNVLLVDDEPDFICSSPRR